MPDDLSILQFEHPELDLSPLNRSLCLMADTTGKIPFRTYETWYTTFGDLSDHKRRPLVLLHGGPGCPHNYLLSIADLATTRPVILYDQIGCGQSTHLRDKGADFWTVELFLEELDNVLAHFGIQGDYDLLGQSWGGMLAAEHAVRQPQGLKHLVIADSPASMPLWLEAAAMLRAELPLDVQETLLKHEEAGTTDSQEYKDAMDVFYDKHVCRVKPMPDYVAKTFQLLEEDPTVYHTMNGPSEFHVIGTLKNWSIVDRVNRITAPTLVINGKYDEATDETVKPFVDGIPHAKAHTFQHSSHLPHVEERGEYMKVVASFLEK